MLGVADGRGLSVDEEYRMRSKGFVMEMPQQTAMISSGSPMARAGEVETPQGCGRLR